MATRVVIVGGGIIGLSLALELQQRGCETRVLERNEIGSEGSGRNAGGVRQQGRVSDEIPLAMMAVEIWQSLTGELRSETEYRQSGNLLVASSQREVSMLEERLKRQAGFDLPSELIDGATLRHLCPPIATDSVAALYCPTDGHANPLKTTMAYAGALTRAGGEIRTGTVTAIESAQGGWKVRVSESETWMEADAVVIAAGPGSAWLVATTGVTLPISNCRVQTQITQRLPPVFPQFVQHWTTGTFARQTASGAVLFGDLVEDFLFPDHRATHDDAVRACQGFRKAFPDLADSLVVRAWGGTIDVSLDEKPIIGPLPDRDGLFVAAGMSGHGFGIGPAVGRLLGEWLTTGLRPGLLAPFDLMRFSSAGTVTNIDGTLEG